MIDQKRNILHQISVEEGLVFRAEHDRYSRAIDDAGEKGRLDIIVINELWHALQKRASEGEQGRLPLAGNIKNEP